MPRQKILEQSLEALLAEASAQMRHLEQIVEVVNRGADHAQIFQLLLRFIEMALNFFELREAVLDILVELHLDGVRDRRELVADVGTNPLDTVPGLRRQRRNFQLERVRLLLPAGGKMLLQGGAESLKSIRQTLCRREVEIALRLLQPAGQVGARLGQFFIETARDRIEPLGQLREGFIRRERAQPGDYDQKPRNRQDAQNNQRCRNHFRIHQSHLHTIRPRL